MIAVETFECSETAGEPIEATEEAIGIIEKMGLSGQQKLLKPDSRVRCPYREMTADERFVYGELCPNKVKLADYDASPIPLRVLQIAAHAESLEMFKVLEVWDRETVTEKDPVLVAHTADSTWDRKTFILARWGEALETFAVLLSRALESRRAKWRQQAAAIAAKVEHISDAEIIEKCSGRFSTGRDIDW